MLISKIDDNTFEVTHVNSKTPPMNLSKDKVREFLLAFKSPDAQVKPFGMDKLVWAPTTREAIGIWVSAADGGLSVWFQGEQFPITQSEVDQLIEDVLLVTTTYLKGTRVELTCDITFSDIGDEVAENLPHTLTVGTEVTIHRASVDFDGEETYILVSDDNRYRTNALTDWFGPVRPVLAYNCIESGRQDVARNITVTAKSEVEAQKLAMEKFRDMPLTAGWYRTGYVERETSRYNDITAQVLDTTDVAKREGWAVGKNGKIINLKGGPFTNASAAYDHVVRQALAGSNIHRHALAQVLGA